MATKKSYITDDLDFAEAQLKSWKQFILSNPIDTITDRRGEKEMPNGHIAKNAIIASRESIIKTVEDTLEKYLRMLSVVDELRAKEEAKQQKVRGNITIPARMEDGE